MDEDRIVTVLVNGEPVETYVDEHGVQRFVPNGVITYLFENDQLDMNEIFKAFTKDEFTLEAYQEFYQGMGFSLSGFEEIFGMGSGIADDTEEPCVILNPIEIHGKTIQ